MYDLKKTYEIGIMVLPRTYLLQRQGSVLAKLTNFFSSLHQLCTRTYQLKSGCAFTGHTALISQIKLGDKKITEQLTTGFSPIGIINIARLVLGRIRSSEISKINDLMLINNIHELDNFSKCFASIWKKISLESGPGKFNEEPWNNLDGESIGLVYQVGPGMYFSFLEMQKYLVLKPDELYSFYPDLDKTNNCGTASIYELKNFINYAKNHINLMYEMQTFFQKNSEKQTNKKFYSENQETEKIALDNLGNIIQLMENLATKNKVIRKGNQGEFTKILKEYGASHEIINKKDGF